MIPLHLVDLDGTVSLIDVQSALEGRGGREIQTYVLASAEHVAGATGLPAATIFQGLKDAILNEVLPHRDQYKYWGSFPASDEQFFKIVPATDHFIMVYAAVELVLERELGQLSPSSPPALKIRAFLDSAWRYPLFKFASHRSLDDAEMEEDARGAIENILCREELVVIMTNSELVKVKKMLEKAKFADRIELGGFAKGKVGAIGGAEKFQVDTSMPKEEIDLSDYFGFPVQLDLRRRVFRGLVRKLFEESRASILCSYTDMPEMDEYPLAAEFGGLVRHGMKLNPCSVRGSIEAARALIGAVTSDRLSVLVEAMRD